jgi:non-canonical poly(A) RNA polymerase PAPD5/7
MEGRKTRKLGGGVSKISKWHKKGIKVISELDTNLLLGETAKTSEPQRVVVHTDVDTQYDYEVASIDIGTLGENLLLSKDGQWDTETIIASSEDDIEPVIEIFDPAPSVTAERVAGSGQDGDKKYTNEHKRVENSVDSNIRALLEDYERQDGIDQLRKDADMCTAVSLKNTVYKSIPWSDNPCLSLRSPTLRLHEEIILLNRCLRPTVDEQQARIDAVERIRQVVKGLWPKSRLEVFGSFATGLFLPSSDIDAVILDSKCSDIRQGLRVLGKALSRKKIAVEVQTILKARVPIIKFVEKTSRYQFDISFDVSNGPEAAELVLALVDVMPAMSALVMVLKVFLQQRELSEVYTGGIGSYALLVMVANFVQTHRSRYVTGKNSTNLGELLMDFFRLHGRSLKQEVVGISCSGGGNFFKKRRVGFHYADRPELFAVQDPHDETNDLGKNSYNALKVRIAFDHAYSRLCAVARPGESLLERIVRLDKLLFSRYTECMQAGRIQGHQVSNAKFVDVESGELAGDKQDNFRVDATKSPDGMTEQGIKDEQTTPPKKTAGKTPRIAGSLKKKPTGATPKKKPTEATPKKKPTEATPKKKPTEATPKKKPTEATPKKKPTGATPKKKPTGATPKKKPTGATPKKKPTGATPKKKPTGATPKKTGRATRSGKNQAYM